MQIINNDTFDKSKSHIILPQLYHNYCYTNGKLSLIMCTKRKRYEPVNK